MTGIWHFLCDTMRTKIWKVNSTRKIIRNVRRIWKWFSCMTNCNGYFYQIKIVHGKNTQKGGNLMRQLDLWSGCLVYFTTFYCTSISEYFKINSSPTEYSTQNIHKSTIWRFVHTSYVGTSTYDLSSYLWTYIYLRFGKFHLINWI